MSKRRKLKTHVHVPVDLDWVVYGPDDDVPAEHAKLITNPKAWADGDAVESGADGDGLANASRRTPVDGAPPKAGKGSGRDEWAEFAESRGVHVDEDDKREDIIAAVEAAGIDTE